LRPAASALPTGHLNGYREFNPVWLRAHEGEVSTAAGFSFLFVVVKVAPDDTIDLRGGLDTAHCARKAQRRQIQLLDECLDNMDRVILLDVVIQTLQAMSGPRS